VVAARIASLRGLGLQRGLRSSRSARRGASDEHREQDRPDLHARPNSTNQTNAAARRCAIVDARVGKSCRHTPASWARLAAYSLYCLSLSVNVRIGISISCAARVLTPPAATSASAIRLRSSSRSSSAIAGNELGGVSTRGGGAASTTGAGLAPPSRSGKSYGSTRSSGAAAVTYSIAFLSSRTLPGQL